MLKYANLINAPVKGSLKIHCKDLFIPVCHTCFFQRSTDKKPEKYIKTEIFLVTSTSPKAFSYRKSIVCQTQWNEEA